MSIRIIIAEDHPLVLAGIRHLLSEHRPDAVLSCTSDFPKTIAMLEKHAFDLLIMDINLPGGDKVGMVHSVRLKQPELPILVCSSYDEKLYALPFMKAGANGYISKTAPDETFITAVDRVLAGGSYVSQDVMEHAFHQLLQGKENSEPRGHKLTERELEVAQLLAKGVSAKSIGRHLNLSPSSVSIYKAKVFEKLGVSNVVDLTTYFQLNA